ncbi:RNHCP domain-containing protein [Candidatus Gracilibacteria bacterium]|nr:RNHCP domain-containing protein [Candidatus Gracilibacteria bacterium]
MGRKSFQKHNEPFICEYCKTENLRANTSERNHCHKCLRSKHVDEEIPGDRLSACGGKMEPMAVRYKGSKGYMVEHQCEKCQKRIWNRAADDDEGLDRLV